MRLPFAAEAAGPEAPFQAGRLCRTRQDYRTPDWLALTLPSLLAL